MCLNFCWRYLIKSSRCNRQGQGERMKSRRKILCSLCRGQPRMHTALKGITSVISFFSLLHQEALLHTPDGFLTCIDFLKGPRKPHLWALNRARVHIRAGDNCSSRNCLWCWMWHVHTVVYHYHFHTEVMMMMSCGTLFTKLRPRDAEHSTWDFTWKQLPAVQSENSEAVDCAKQ